MIPSRNRPEESWKIKTKHPSSGCRRYCHKTKNLQDDMKAIRCRMAAYTRFGWVCSVGDYDSISKAKKDAKFLIEEGYAHSYKIIKL